MTALKIVNASANNLSNLSVELPLKKFVALTGPSGSGKTTLLRDIIYGEWRRRISDSSTKPSQLILSLPPVFYFGSQRPPRSRETVLEGIGAASYLLELGLRGGESRCILCQGSINYESLDDLYLRLSRLVGTTIVVGIELTQEEITNTNHESALRVIVDGEVRRYQTLDSNKASLVRALDAIKISDSSKSRLLELLKHAQAISNSKIFILNDGILETICLVPTCSTCKGQQRAITRRLLEDDGYLSPEFLSLVLGQSSISSLLSLSFDEVSKELVLLGELRGLEGEILKSLQLTVDCVCQLGLGYLSLDRKLRTLSSGEFQRVKLASVLVGQVYGSLLVLDEPSGGLSPSDTTKLGKILSSITKEGNSVLVATHSRELIEASDQVLELQREPTLPVVRFQGLAADFLASKSRSKFSSYSKPTPTKFLHLSKVNLNNLVDLECKIPLATLTCLYGVSGSGKSTLALQVLFPLVTRLIKERGSEVELSFGRISTDNHPIGRVVFFRAARFFSLRRAGVISALGAVPAIRELYLKTELAKIRGIGTREINFYNPSPQAQELRFKGVAYSELQNFSISESLKLFDKIPALKNKFKSAVDLGIGYLKLSQPLKELSAGEEQRLNLAAKVSVLGPTNTLFILDEPLNGLSEEEQIPVLEYLRSIVQKGHTIVSVEHSPLMLKFSDWNIELGPGAGKNGGVVIRDGERP